LSLPPFSPKLAVSKPVKTLPKKFLSMKSRIYLQRGGVTKQFIKHKRGWGKTQLKKRVLLLGRALFFLIGYQVTKAKRQLMGKACPWWIYHYCYSHSSPAVAGPLSIHPERNPAESCFQRMTPAHSRPWCKNPYIPWRERQEGVETAVEAVDLYLNYHTVLIWV
jgi:hypothetical protein